MHNNKAPRQIHKYKLNHIFVYTIQSIIMDYHTVCSNHYVILLMEYTYDDFVIF